MARDEDAPDGEAPEVVDLTARGEVAWVAAGRRERICRYETESVVALVVVRCVRLTDSLTNVVPSSEDPATSSSAVSAIEACRSSQPCGKYAAAPQARAGT
jgi:hypothetical protein